MAVVELTLVPIGTQQTSVSAYVAKAYDAARAFKAAQDRQITVALNPMGTVLEGEIDTLFACVRVMQEAVFEAGAGRVYSVLKVDDRRDKATTIDDKVASVMQKSAH